MTMRMGGQVLSREAIRPSPQLARITDAAARPIGGGLPYNARLLDTAGNTITGSDFPAYEVNADRNVPNNLSIEVVPVQGDWGFLQPEGYLL